MTIVSFEQEMEDLLFRAQTKHGWAYYNNCDDSNQTDFAIQFGRQARWFHLELKEKRQPFNPINWPEVPVPREHVFILDELTVRRLLGRAPFGGIALREIMTGKYYFFPITRLILMPKVRMNRSMGERKILKGKWILDLRNGHDVDTIKDLLRLIYQYAEKFAIKDVTTTECIGDYVGEEIPIGGRLRTEDLKQIDLEATR